MTLRSKLRETEVNDEDGCIFFVYTQFGLLGRPGLCTCNSPLEFCILGMCVNWHAQDSLLPTNSASSLKEFCKTYGTDQMQGIKLTRFKHFVVSAECVRFQRLARLCQC